MEIEMSGGCRVGKGGGFVKEPDQASALPEVRRGGASDEEAPGLDEELLREVRAMERRRARHGTTPGAIGQLAFSDDTLSIVVISESR